ncbi:uncharacterized protein [Nicotiana sylvestris]|uniref:Uncharacterized protein LOC104226771 n=1 Tax=Nicotiana sylvestris TaxID=4096 RepID=A0A1U7WAW9_NICSY|nr:PREDICTED: uncharacterized protein LOC104226771 [Nicotiana sylvestris]
MAIDMISEAPSLTTSPRISFSHNLCHKDIATTTNASNDFNSEFDFCISSSTDTETSSADELFSDGLIRPLQLQEKFVTSSKQFPLSKTQTLFNSIPPLPVSSSENEISKQEIKSEQQQKNLSNSISFWGIKRSSSVHCVNTHKKSSFWSLPLLSRSNSTGSVPNSKQSVQKQSSAQWKQMKNSSSAAAASFYTSQKPPLRKNYGNAIRISPILNVPFGLGSLFCNGKDNKKSKK